MKIMFSCIHFPEWPYPPQNNEKAVFYTGELYGLTGREIRKNGLTVRASVMWQNDGPGMVSEKVVLREGWSLIRGMVFNHDVLTRVVFHHDVLTRVVFYHSGLTMMIFYHSGLTRVAFQHSGLTMVIFYQNGLTRVVFCHNGLAKVVFHHSGLTRVIFC